MSYLDNEIFKDDLYLEEDSDLDTAAHMSEEEILDKAMDEEYEIVINMYYNLKNYMDNKPYLFPIMNILNQNNFTVWLSKHLYPKENVIQPKKSKPKHKIETF